jgi:hypothetical protein
MVSYGASLFLMATMKANDTAVMIPGFSLVLFAVTKVRWKAVGVSLVSFVCFLLFLELNHFSFFGLLNAYLYISPHGASLFPFLVDYTPDEKRLALVIITGFVLPAVVVIAQGRGGGRSIGARVSGLVMVGALIAWFMSGAALKPLAAAAITVPVLLALVFGRGLLNSPGIWIGAIGLLGGVYGCLTNSEMILVDIPPVMIGAILLITEARGVGTVFQMPVRWSRYFCFLCAVLGCLALAQGYSRARIRAVGPGKFFEYDDSEHTIASGFFKGEHCGDNLYNVLNDIGEVVRREPSASIWFGVRMQWAYAAFDKPSPAGQPVVWDPLTMFERGKEEEYFKELLQRRYQLMILLKSDFDFPPNQKERLMEQYETDLSYRHLILLRLISLHR